MITMVLDGQFFQTEIKGMIWGMVDLSRRVVGLKVCPLIKPRILVMCEDLLNVKIASVQFGYQLDGRESARVYYNKLAMDAELSQI